MKLWISFSSQYFLRKFSLFIFCLRSSYFSLPYLAQSLLAQVEYYSICICGEHNWSQNLAFAAVIVCLHCSLYNASTVPWSMSKFLPNFASLHSPYGRQITSAINRILNNFQAIISFCRLRKCLFWECGYFSEIRQICRCMAETSLFWCGSTDLTSKSV
jgi:hypothetical protein